MTIEDMDMFYFLLVIFPFDLKKITCDLKITSKIKIKNSPCPLRSPVIYKNSANIKENINMHFVCFKLFNPILETKYSINLVLYTLITG